MKISVSHSFFALTLSLFTGLMLSCCSNKTNRPKASTAMHMPAPILKADTSVSGSTDKASEVMDANEIKLNGKLKRYFTIQQFNSVLGKADSSKLLSVVGPCATIFEKSDGFIDPAAKYLYKNGSVYENVKDKVAIQEINFSKGDMITFHGKTLSNETTLADLQELFPNAVRNIGVMDVKGRGKLQVIMLREDKNNVSEGHINLFIKNGKLHYMEWWFPC
ncbi:MAG: hypothetical protein JKY70_08015 [Mucilaginibacter sp.]|nr:hypothetical protein [Mucilaginibacter sp.]